ncbi:MAG: TonB-dependent receptor [Bacteroidales bacterium]|nr:TonB-dependent receptor [Bacteroidales bacterium]
MKYFFTIVVVLELIIITNIDAQSNIKIRMQDALTKESLIGAIVYDSINNRYAVTNNYGYTQIRLPSDSIMLTFICYGYEKLSQYIKSCDSLVIIALNPQTIEIDSVNIVYKSSKQIRQGHYTLTQTDMINTPVLFAEKDVLKTLQLMPGVIQNMENSSNFTVRGGNNDQNLMLMDGIPVYNINHLYGFVSIYNTDACNKVNFLKGGIPARYGGRLSSVVDVFLKEGNKEKYTGGISLNSMASRVYFEGPLNKSKSSSFLLAARRTLYDLLISPLLYLMYKGTIGYYYQDVTIKSNFPIKKHNTLFLSTYYGADNYYTKSKNDNNKLELGRGWNNITNLLRWNNTYFSNVIFNVSVAYTQFNYLSYHDEKIRSSDLKILQEYRSGIGEYIGKTDISYLITNRWSINFGSFYSFRLHNLGSNIIENNDIKSSIKNITRCNEYGAYIENELKINSFEINAGFRLERYTVKSKKFSNILPRLNVSLAAEKNLILSFSYDRTAQYLQLVSNTNTGLPNDLWIPIMENFKPLLANQLAAGIKYTLPKYHFTVETFYKNLKNLVDYRDGVILREQYNDWGEILVPGKGKSYGIEIMVEKTYGSFTGWITYTYSRSFRKFEEINHDIEFPFVYDRPHSGNISISYKLSNNQTINTTWFYSSGYLYSIPTDIYRYKDNYIVNVIERNNYRTPFYHHLDVAYRFSRPFKKGTGTFIMGVYNLYGRINPISVRYVYKDFDEKYIKPYLQLTGLFYIFPYVAFEFKLK